MLRKEGPSQRLYDEISSIEDSHFRFSEETPAIDNVEDLAEAMQFYPSTDYITGSSLYFEFDPQVKFSQTDYKYNNNLIQIFIVKYNFIKTSIFVYYKK